MTLIIKKIAENLYEARVAPPHAKTEWSTVAPVPGRYLTTELLRLGCHQRDIGDAMYEQDPKWVEKLE